MVGGKREEEVVLRPPGSEHSAKVQLRARRAAAGLADAARQLTGSGEFWEGEYFSFGLN